MERESFEDDYVAQLLNEHFISIKVDREERPDIDHLYMEFCQVLSGSGGWPLTIIMTPEKEPFFAGTYFPRTSQYGRAGLLDILRQTSLIWQEDKERLIKAAIEIATAVRKISDSSEPAVIHDQGLKIQSASNHADTEFRHKAAALLDKAYTHLENSFDSHYGGFGQAPKFPSPHTIGFLLRCPGSTYSKAPTMTRKTLDGMQQGGIYDHIGFGFARYSTDEMWLVPHFEKMLYDNALLAYVYLEASQSLGDKKYLQTAQDIFTYILRDMTSPEGGFYSAEDADSEGVEGKFYLWSPAEIINLLGSESGEMFMNYYGITPQGNYQGKNIPNLLNSSKEVHGQRNQVGDLNKEQLAMKLEQCRSILFAAREKRIHPHKDDKILTSWNGLMIAALAKGFFITGDRAYRKAAEKSVNFILSTLRQSDGRLLARYRDHQAAYLAYLDDYAFLIWGLLECYTALGLPYYLKTAIELQNQQEILFQDEKGGGYFLTGIDSEKLLFRPKQTFDSALPSGNSVSVFNLLRLARLTAEVRWEQLAYRQLIEYLPKADSNPEGYTMFLQAVQFFLHSGQDLILAGSLNSPQKRKMQEIISQHFLPYATILYQEGSVNSITPWLADYPYNSNEYKCYICENHTCQQPISSPEELTELFGGIGGHVDSIPNSRKRR